MKLKNIALAATLAIAATAALADDQSIMLSQTGAGTFSGAFSTTEAQSGLILDTFVFSLPATFGSLLGSGGLTFSSFSGPVSLVLATLDAANDVSVASPPDADTIAFPSTLSFSNATAPLTLTVLGFAGDAFTVPVPLTAGYRGTVTFNAAVEAIPEPETYALMLAGLVGVAFFARRRKAKAHTFA